MVSGRAVGALSCCWRTDGEPLWRDQQWLADETRDYGFGEVHARQLMARLLRYLAVDASRVVPGYEDVYYYLWREGNLPFNVDPFDSKLSDRIERERLRRLFEAGLDRVVGLALPLAHAEDHEPGPRWRSSRSSGRKNSRKN